ncbi:MAG: cation:proton antiporter [Bacteroidetes bacterium]|nr:cation:proton antiporter [Bacteroidota bacterium]
MASKLTSQEVLNFLIIVTIVLISARFLGEICRKLKQPVVIGEIIAGIIIGPSVVGTLFPNFFHQIFLSQPRAFGAFDGLANIGVILLMFVAGIEVDLKQIVKQGKQAASISILGILFPFLLGFITIWFFHDFIFATPSKDRLIPAMFFGTALSITALSVIVKVLMDLQLMRTKIGSLVLTGAMVNDFLGWILFSIIVKMMDVSKSDGDSMSVIIVLLFAIFMVTIGRWVVNQILRLSVKYLSPPGGIITVGICLCFLGAVFTEALHIRGVFGAFLVGIAVGDSKHFSMTSQNVLEHFILNIIAPLFFASVGLQINFLTHFDLSVVLIIIGISFTAKLVGTWIGARASGMTRNESKAVAFGMNARGSQEIVLGLVALQTGIIDETIFVGLVIMTVVSILVTGPAMKYYFNKDMKSKVTQPV